MPTIYEIPTVPLPQQFSVQLAGTTYNMQLTFHEANGGQASAATGADAYVPGAVTDTNILDGWLLDISDSGNKPIACGIPLVAGIDLLYQFAYLNIGGALVAAVDGNPSDSPAFTTLGSTSHLYFVTFP